MKLFFKVLIILVLFSLTGCDPNSPLSISISPPNCDLISLEKYDGAFAVFAKDVLTVKNVGDGATAYNVGCTIELKRGNTIIDWGSASFGTLEPGESAIDKALFSEIQSHSEYESSKITLYWYDAENGFYEKVISR
jgi:hypothetical protein